MSDLEEKVDTEGDINHDDTPNDINANTDVTDQGDLKTDDAHLEVPHREVRHENLHVPGGDVREHQDPDDEAAEEIPQHAAAGGILHHATVKVDQEDPGTQQTTNLDLEDQAVGGNLHPLSIRETAIGDHQGGKASDEVGDYSVYRKSNRNRKLTEKGLLYNIEIAVKNLKSALVDHSKCGLKCEQLLSEENVDVERLYDMRDMLERHMSDVSDTYHRVAGLSEEEKFRFDAAFHECTSSNRQLFLSLTQAIRRLERHLDSARSHKSHGSHRSHHSPKSHHSQSSRKSHDRSSRSNRSHKSHSSTTSVKIEAAAKAAELRARLKYLDEENVHKQKLERLSLIKDLEVQEAKIQVINEIEVESVRDFSVKAPVLAQTVQVGNTGREAGSIIANAQASRPVIQSDAYQMSNRIEPNVVQSVPIVQIQRNGTNNVAHVQGLNYDAPVFTPRVSPPANLSVPVSTIETDRSNSSIENLPQVIDVLKTLCESSSVNRLPVPEPGVFSGEPLEYPAWRSAFSTLIENRKIEPAEKVHYLKRYLGGKARQSVEGLLLIPSADSFEAALELIHKRYGNRLVVAQAFKSKLEAWPKIAARDYQGLRCFADFLVQCEVAARNNVSLKVLDDDMQNRVMITKLPDWLISRWGRKVHDVGKSEDRYPSFKEFVTFVVNEADIVCNPVTQMLKAVPSATSGSLKNSGSPTERSRTLNTANSVEKCILCDMSNHAIDRCFKLSAMSFDERKAFVIKNGLCFGCLKSGHLSSKCKARARCSKCQKKHPTSLHLDNPESLQQKDKSESKHKPSSNQNQVITHFTEKHGSSKSAMIVPVYVSSVESPQDEILVYALLDTQSDTSFISKDTFKKLGVDGDDTTLLLSTMTAECNLVESKCVGGLQVRGYNSDVHIKMPNMYTHQGIPCNRDSIPCPSMARNWPHLQEVAGKLMPKSNCEFGVLIGYNCPQALIPREVVSPAGQGPFALRTDLGWAIVGIIDGSDGNNPSISHFADSNVGRSNIVLKTTSKEMMTPQDVARFFGREEGYNPFTKGLSQDDMKFLQLMQESIHKTSDEHYEMPLPFKNPNDIPISNKQVAVDRLRGLVKRCQKDQQYRQHYVTCMTEMIENGYAEEVPADELDDNVSAYYLPHHGVYNPAKPGKVRVVMDASAKYKGQSLNSLLLPGPDMLNGLVGILCRFRQEKIAFMCDIKGMYHQFKVNKEHRNYLRFLWFKEGNFNEQPTVYRSTVHLFGVVSSPAVANFGLKQAASDALHKYGQDTVDFIHNDFYVDDGLKSLATEEEAISLIQRSRLLCKESGLTLHKFVSNCRSVIESIPMNDRSDKVKTLDLSHDPLPVERALGVQWCMESDVFQFRVVVDSSCKTRRGILRTVCSIFDPLGFIAPVCLQGKMILQEMCRDKLDWDDPLPDRLAAQWERWIGELHCVQEVAISRCFKPPWFGEVVLRELHFFSDACCTGYGQCTYLRSVDCSGQVYCALVMAKSRVAPLKTLTIPRLELTAAALSAEVSCLLNRELTHEGIEKFFWTDSKVVLGFINNESRRFQVFVANRVQQIQDNTTTEQWKYVSTQENPADIASRGASGRQLVESRWFDGPTFLWQDCINFPEEKYDVDPGHLEVKKVCLETKTEQKLQNVFPRNCRSWKSLVRIAAICLKFVNNLKTQTCASISVSDESIAVDVLIRQVQREEFTTEVLDLQAERSVKKSSPLFKLDPFLDTNGVIRVGGRIQQSSLAYEMKHPAILPKMHMVTDLILAHCHSKIAHQGRGMTMNSVRNNGFWIIGLSKKVSSLIHGCVVCKRQRGPTSSQKMANLPEARLEPSPPFSYVGVDYFGPYYIKSGRHEVKRYGVLFTCFNSRAIHIETANSLTADSFINAFRRFQSVRGPIRQLWSDRGTNIVGGCKQLTEAMNQIDDEKVRKFLLDNSCDFVTNVPDASHHGGIWERQIRTLRSVLNSLLGSNCPHLDDESFRTFMLEAACIVNSRPLTVQSLSDPTSLEPLTPNHLLTLKSGVVLPPPGSFKEADVYGRKLWKRVQYLTDLFWSRWKKEVLNLWQVRSKWQRPQSNLEVGDIVLVVDQAVPRCQWNMAMVVEVYPSQDELVRKVKLLMGDPALSSQGKRRKPAVYLERPVTKLVLLLKNNRAHTKTDPQV